mmetsp:Transcript_13506/g.27610  ORF Transcript_13506/g.27610 Transcript_13506/m.27610 type:complete len:344 (-) Transcript_13506:46-1077(-)
MFELGPFVSRGHRNVTAVAVLPSQHVVWVVSSCGRLFRFPLHRASGRFREVKEERESENSIDELAKLGVLVTAIASCQDGTVLAGTTRGGVYWVDSRGAVLDDQQNMHAGEAVRCMSFCSWSRSVVTADGSGKLKRWWLRKRGKEAVDQLEDFGGQEIRSIVCVLSGQQALTVLVLLSEQRLALWSEVTGRAEAFCPKFDEFGTTAEISAIAVGGPPDSKVVWIGFEDGRLMQFEFLTGRYLRGFCRHEKPIRGISCAENANIACIFDSEGLVLGWTDIFDPKSKKEPFEICRQPLACLSPPSVITRVSFWSGGPQGVNLWTASSSRFYSHDLNEEEQVAAVT